MSLRLATPATATIVSVAEAKAHLHILHDDEDDYIGSLVETAQDWIAGEKSWLGRSVIEQGWELTLSAFPVGKIKLPKPPLKAVSDLRYTPVGGTEVAFVGFRTFDVGVLDGGYILPPVGGSWPAANGEPDAVRITFTAGFTKVPPSIKHAALLLIGHWFENREAASEADINDLPMAVDALLTPYRDWAT